MPRTTPYERTFNGVGYMGEGPYGFSREAGGPYNRWFGMFQRCYAPTSERVARIYSGCTVDPAWHNFQDFAKWFYDQPHHTEKDYQIDKDLLVFGNKIYAPERCCLIPTVLNYAIRNEPPAANLRGVKKHKSGKFEARASRSGKYVYLGIYETESEAHSVWKESQCMFLTELGDELLHSEKIERRTREHLDIFIHNLRQGLSS